MQNMHITTKFIKRYSKNKIHLSYTRREDELTNLSHKFLQKLWTTPPLLNISNHTFIKRSKQIKTRYISGILDERMNLLSFSHT